MATAKQSKPGLNYTLIVPLVLVMAGIPIYWYLEKDVPYQPGPGITAEAKTYVRNLALSDVEMKAAENAIRQQVVEITGKITNKGDRQLQSVAIFCIFYDAYGQVVLKERLEIVRKKLGGLKPAETRSFRLPFDNLPASWNQGPPQLVIASIEFG